MAKKLTKLDFDDVSSQSHANNRPTPVLQNIYLPSAKTGAETKSSRFGFPQFKWSLSLFGLCLYTFSIITFRLPLAQVGIAVGLLGLFTSRKSMQFPAPIWLYMTFLLWAWVSSFASPFPSDAFNEVIERFKLLVIIVLVINTLRSEGQLRFYLLFVLLCFILFPARGTLLGGDTIQGRAVWNFIYSNPNDLAALSLLALGIAASFVFSETDWNLLRIGALLSVLVLLLVILLTQSRGVFLGLMVAAVPAAIPILFKKLHLAIGIAIVAALAISFIIPPKVWVRLIGIENLTSTETIAKADHEGSAAERFEIQKVGWHIFRENPILGVGIGTYKLANNMYSPKLGKRDTHNTYLNLAAETGLPGLILWCTLVVSSLYHAYHVRRSAKMSVLKRQQYWIERSFIGYLVAALVGTYANLNFPYIIISTLWCSSMLLKKTSSLSVRQSGASRA